MMARIVEHAGLAADAVYFPAARVVVVRAGLPAAALTRVLRDVLAPPAAAVAGGAA